MRVRDNKKLRQKKEESLDLCSVLIRLLSLALSQTEPERAISQTLKETKRIFKAKLCWMFLVEDKKIKLKSVGETKSRQNLIKSQLLPKLSPEILNRSYPLICNHIGELYKKSRVMHGFLRKRNIHKFMGVSLKEDGKLFGVLNVVRDSASPGFTQQDLKSLSLLGTMIVVIKLKRAEEGVRQSQEFLEAIISNVPNPIFIKDKKHRYRVMNQACLDLVGYPREKMLSKSDYDLFPKDQADFFWKKDEEMFRTGKVIDILEEPITDKEGNVHYLHTKKAPLRDSSGKITHLVGIIEDITEPKRTEEALRESENRYRDLTEKMIDVIYTLDTAGKVTSVNEASKTVFGFNSDEVIGENFTKWIPKEERPKAMAAFKQILSGEKIITETILIDKDGKPHNVEFSSTRIIKARKIVGTRGIIRDITERKRAESALRESEEKYRLLVENIKEGIYSTHKGVFTSVNESMSRMFGYSKKELIGMPSWNLAVPEIRNSVKDMFLEKAAKKDYSPAEVKCARKDGSVFIAEIRLSRISGKQRFLGVVTDITDRKRAEEELNRIFNISSDMIGIASADGYFKKINPAVEKILGYTVKEFLKTPYLDLVHPDDQAKTADAVKKELATGMPTIKFENRYRCKDGSYKWLEWTAHPIKEEKSTYAVARDITERKRAEEEIRKFKTISDRAGYGMAISDLEGNLLYLNESFAKMHGYTADKLIGRNLSIFHNEEQKKNVNRLKEQLRQKGSYVAEEVWHRRKDDTAFPTLMNGSLIRDEKGKPLFMAATAIDITERKRAEESLRESEKRYRALFKGAAEGILVADIETEEFKYANPAICRVLGYTEEELKRMKVLDIHPKDSSERVISEFKAHARGEKKLAAGMPCLRKDGTTVYADINTARVLIDGRECNVGLFMDITERKQAEEALQKSEQMFRTIVETAPGFLIIYDINGKNIYVSPNCEKVTGYSKEELMEETIWWTHDDDTQRSKKALESSISTGKGVRDFEYKLVKKNGDVIYASSSWEPIKDEHGKVTRIIMQTVDITDRKRTEKALIRNERIVRERARLLTDIRNLDRIDDILTRVCEAVRDSGLFERAVMTLHDQVSQIVHLGQVGLPPVLVRRARREPPIDDKLRARITSKRFRISDSFFIPVEAGVDFSKTGRYMPQKRRKSVGGDWQPGDELFIPLRDFSGKIMGYLSVDTPMDGCRPDVKTIEALEMMVEAAASRVREVEAQQVLKRERDFSKSILETANSLVVCLDADAKITVFNHECERVTGYRHEEVLGKSWPELFIPSDHHRFKSKSFAKWVRAHPRDRYEGPILTKSGEIRIILWSNTAIIGSGEKDVVAIALGHDITERKRVEEALHISQDRYTLCTQAANVGVWDWDIKTNKFYLDPIIKESLGYKDEEIPNDIEIWLTYVHPDDREPVMTAAQACIDGKTPEYVFEHRMMHKDGSVRWILSRGNVIRDAKGNTVRMVGTDTDITEHKRAEEALQESEEKYRELINTSVDGVISVNPQMKIILWNPGAESMFGYSEKEVLGQSLLKIVPERYRKAKEKGFVEFRKIGLGSVVGKTVEFEGLRKDGTKFPIELSVSSKKIGKTYIATSIVRDITDRKRAEEALQRSERKYRTLVETAQEGIGISDHEENLIFVNQAVANLLGYKKEELLGKNLKDICDEAHYVMFRKETQKRKKGDSSKYEVKLLTKKGNPKYFYVSAAPLWNEDGSFMGTLAVLSDLTEMKKAREYDILLDTSRALSRTLRFDQVLELGAKKMTQALNADRCAVLISEDGTKASTLRVQIYTKKTEVLPPVLKLRATPDGIFSYKRLLQAQKYLIVIDRRTGSLPELARKILRKTKMISGLIIPMLMGKKMLGAFHVGTENKRKTFAEDEIQLVLTMANQVAVALENCRLMESLEREHSRIVEQAKVLKRQTEEKDTLLRVSRALSKTINLNEVSQVASHVVGSAMGVERCAVTLATEDGNQLEIKGLFSKGKTDAHKLIGTKFLWGDIPAMTKAIKKGEPFVINDISDVPSKSKTREYFRKVGIKSVVGAGMFFGKKLVGILSITSIKEQRTFSQEETKLVQTMANQIAVAIENARLLEVIKKHTQDLRDLSAELMKVQENERKRIAQELHDEVGQMLQSMKMNLDRIKRNLSSKPQKLEGIGDWLLDTEKLLGQTIDDIRTLIFDLRPSMLDDFGLIPTLRWFIENYSRRSNIKVSLKAKDPKYRFPAEVEITLYRIIQEALTNVSKHAQATEASVSVSQRNCTAILSVRDNGAGFDTSKFLSAPRGMGLLNMKERVNLLGGSFEIISRPRKGTRVNINIPFSEVKHEEGQITGG